MDLLGCSDSDSDQKLVTSLLEMVDKGTVIGLPLLLHGGVDAQYTHILIVIRAWGYQNMYNKHGLHNTLFFGAKPGKEKLMIRHTIYMQCMWAM
jgi:hypothetical protein